MLAAQPPPHPLPLLIGLNLGPNLAFTGSLSYYLWYRAARSADADPSVRHAARLGLILAPLTIAGALLALWLVQPDAL
jgi:arsenical pump membrane protein